MSLTRRIPKRIYPRMPKRLPLIEQYPLYGLSFAGGYVSTSLGNSVKGLTQVSLEVWFRPSVLDGQAHAIYFEPISTDPGLARFLLRIENDNALIFGGRAPDGDSFTIWIDSAVTLRVNALYHAVAIFDSVTDTHFLYLNGVPESATVAEPAFDNTDPNVIPRIGLSTHDLWPFNGMIPLLRLYNRVLTPRDIQHNMHNPLNPVRDGLILWLPMLEGFGTSLKDYSGLGNDGTISGAVSWVDLAKYEIPAGAGL